MEPKTHSLVSELQEQYQKGTITRREFIRRAMLLSVSMSSIGAFLIGCAGPTSAPPASSPTSAPTAAPQPTAAPSPTSAPTGLYGELKIGVASFGVESFDPVKASKATNMYLISPMYDYLAMTDASGKVKTGIAENWEMAEDGSYWTFYIRKGIKFHNGDPLTAEDVKFSLERYATSEDSHYKYLADSQDHVEIVDDYTVRVYTKGPQPYYWRFVNPVVPYQGIIFPKAYFENKGADYFEEHPVGAGPFKFVSHVTGDSVEYEAVPDHYRQVPAFQKVSLIQVPEEATRISMLKTGELDATDISLDAIPEVEAAGFKTMNLAPNQAGVVFLGAYDPRAEGMPIADIRVRNALSLAINRDELRSTFFHDKLGPAMPPTMWPEQPEIDVEYWKAEAAKVYRYDLDQAKQLLDEAGYSDGFSFKLYTWSTAGGAYLPKLAPILQGYWLKVGAVAEIVPIDLASFSALRRSGPNKGCADELVGQATVAGYLGNAVAPQAMVTYFTASGLYDVASTQIGQNAELDTTIMAALTEPDDSKRFDLTAKAIQLAMDTRVYVVIGAVPTVAALGQKVEMDLPSSAATLPMYLEFAKHGAAA